MADEVLDAKPEQTRRKKLSAEEKSRLLAEWRASGLSAGKFCRSKGINSNVIYRLTRKRRGAKKIPTGGRKSAKAAFVQLALERVDSPRIEFLEIQLSGGHFIRFHRDIPVDVIARIVGIFESAQC